MSETLDLIVLCKKNDRKAQHELYKRYFGFMMSVAMPYRRNREDALELVNMAFFKAFVGIEQFQQGTSFEAWLRRILKNHIIDEFRKKVRLKEDLVFSDNEGAYSDLTEDDLVMAEKKVSVDEIELLLEKLPEEERMVFNLFELEEYSHKEIAELLNCSERTTKRYLASAKAKLKEQLENVLNKFSVTA